MFTNRSSFSLSVLIAIAGLFTVGTGHADVDPSQSTSTAADVSNEFARARLTEAQANRLDKNMALKAWLTINRRDKIPVEILVQNQVDEVRTIYRSGATEALIVQPNNAAPRYFVRGAGELKGDERLQHLAGSQFTFYDLGLPFLRWTNATYLGVERQRGRTCHVIEVTQPGEPYPKVKLWLDREYQGLLRAEAIDENNQPIRRFTVTSFRKIGEAWIPRGLEMSFVPRGQSLPAAETSRLEIYSGDYDAKLDADQFDTDRFKMTPK